MADLPVGYILSDYKIEKVLGHGGFGVTYLAIETELSRRVAIKEYFPKDFAVRGGNFKVHPANNPEAQNGFSWGLQRFLEEAKTLTLFTHPNIIAVRRYFKKNGTAYLVMDYCDGDSLDKIMKERKAPLSKAALDKILLPLLSGLAEVHRHNILHRDIKPANLYIREDGSPVLLDFGSSRIVNPGDAVTNLVTAGYAAIEQYSEDGDQGTWTDMYGLGATLYRAVTGDRPLEATARILKDTLIPAVDKARGSFHEDILAAIDAALVVNPEGRIRTVDEWRKVMTKRKEEIKSRGVEDGPSTLTDIVTLGENIGKGRPKLIRENSQKKIVWMTTVPALVFIAIVAGGGYLAKVWNFQSRDNPSSVATNTTITTPVEVPAATPLPVQAPMKSPKAALPEPSVEQTNVTPTLPPGYIVDGGLVWAPIVITANWPEASAKCSASTAGGYTWRQPTDSELLASYSRLDQGKNFIWSASSTKNMPQLKQHYAFSMEVGENWKMRDMEPNYVSCVTDLAP